MAGGKGDCLPAIRPFPEWLFLVWSVALFYQCIACLIIPAFITIF